MATADLTILALGRVLGGAVVALVLWFAAWAISYQVLSEGVLRDVMSARVPDDLAAALAAEPKAQTMFSRLTMQNR